MVIQPLSTRLIKPNFCNNFCSIAINYVVNTYDFPLKAAQHGAKECVHWLLQKRASPNIRDGKFLWLMIIGHTQSTHDNESSHDDLRKSGWHNKHKSRLPPLLQMLYVDWVSVNLNLTSRVFSGHSGFLPPQNRLLVYSIWLSPSVSLAIWEYKFQVPSSKEEK